MSVRGVVGQKKKRRIPTDQDKKLSATVVHEKLPLLSQARTLLPRQAKTQV